MVAFFYLCVHPRKWSITFSNPSKTHENPLKPTIFDAIIIPYDPISHPPRAAPEHLRLGVPGRARQRQRLVRLPHGLGRFFSWPCSRGQSYTMAMVIVIYICEYITNYTIYIYTYIYVCVFSGYIWSSMITYEA